MATANDFPSETYETVEYLRDGGMGEVFGFIELARDLGQDKVQMDRTMAAALASLASFALDTLFDDAAKLGPFTEMPGGIN